MAVLPDPSYASRTIKASALIADTKVLLNTWDLDSPVAENLDRVVQGVMAALRDFGVLQGIDNDHMAPIYPPMPGLRTGARKLPPKGVCRRSTGNNSAIGEGNHKGGRPWPTQGHTCLWTKSLICVAATGSGV